VEGNSEHDQGQDGTGEADRTGSDGTICGPETEAEAESAVRVLADGVPRGMGGSRTDQLRALGNAVVPVVAAKAFITLARKFGWIISR
jgi:hypothetical protein